MGTAVRGVSAEDLIKQAKVRGIELEMTALQRANLGKILAHNDAQRRNVTRVALGSVEKLLGVNKSVVQRWCRQLGRQSFGRP